MTGEAALPLLWQIRLSLFSEKVRWALDFKRVPHRRRSLMPGLHPYLLPLLRRGRTVPVLDLAGSSITDSTAIIAALERAHPEPALYPSDPDARDAAARLEEFFDERCAHDLRRLTLDPILSHRPLVRRYFLAGQPRLTRAVAGSTLALSEPLIRRNYGIADDTLPAARAAVEAAFDRLEAALGGRDYLVGDRFTVADLTAASLLSYLVLPAEASYPTWHVDELPAAVVDLRDAFRDRTGFAWVAEMYRRHRMLPPGASDHQRPKD